MGRYRNDLMDLITNSGVSHEDAEAAVDRCQAAIVKQGFLAGEIAGVIGFFVTGKPNPASALAWGLAGSAGGAALAPLTSPQCSEVRNAVRFWLAAL